ncbi:hypothetical protein ACFFTN_25175 [Aminobacter aganoensis]|uniref:Uncharacterized protein n=1 Tax=Aminobacter aganoensis TaxID=83264 RepID=A0A7X0F7J5_9HYPH|nr:MULTISPECIES: hypothetical protein [Aminobacter]KQU75725.1 hypothetical protein ASC75_16960 [Aminobacter sp. DSM 101952]MBB6354558.1 hypothetical protein [Aminobacter aganoensis]
MGDQPELTLEELLHDPIILKLMERDGYSADDIRMLARHAMAGTQGWESVSSRVSARRRSRLFHPVPSTCATPTLCP